MSIKIPTIGPQGNVGGSIPLTMQPRDLTYSGLNLKSHAGDNLKLLAGAGEKFVADLTKLQVQIKKDQDDATLLDLQNKINEEDLSIFASLVDPDNENNALGVNATDARYAELVRNKKQAGNGVLSGNLQGIYADYGEQIAGLSRTSQVALKKFILTNNVSFEQKLLSHFSEQSKAYKTQALETDILRAEQALPTDATAFDANIKNLTLKIAGLLKYQGLYSVENVQTQLHEKFSVGVHDTIMGMLARGDVAGAEEFYKTYVVDDGYTVVPAGDDGTGGISAVLKGSHRTAIDNAIASATEEVAISAGFDYIQNLPDIVVDGKKIPVIDDRVNMRDHLNKLIKTKINGVIITEEHVDKIYTRINQHHTNVKNVHNQEQDAILKKVQAWVEVPENKNKKIPAELTAGLDINNMRMVQKYQVAVAESGTAALLVSNYKKLQENWFTITPEAQRDMTLEDFKENVLKFANDKDAITISREYRNLQRDKEKDSLIAMAAADKDYREQISEQNKDAFAYAKEQIASSINKMRPRFQVGTNALQKTQADAMLAQWELSIKRELYERMSQRDLAAMSFQQVDQFIANYSMGFAADRSGERRGANIFYRGTELDLGTILETSDIPLDWVAQGPAIKEAQKNLQMFSNKNRFEVVSLYTQFAKNAGYDPNIKDLNEFVVSLDAFITNEVAGKNNTNDILTALEKAYENKSESWDKVKNKKEKVMNVIARSIYPMDVLRTIREGDKPKAKFAADVRAARQAGEVIKSKQSDEILKYVLENSDLQKSPAFQKREED